MSGIGPAPVHRLTAYPLEDAAELDMKLVPAPSRRSWMDEATHTYHCLPLKIANQAGWFVLNSRSIEVVWTGGSDRDSVVVRYLDGGPPHPALSHFGYALLTFRIPYLFRTPPGYNLLVRGPANQPKDGAFALDGLIETDWSPAAFFMSWRLTRVDQPVRFERGEAICMIVPQQRCELERFAPEVRDLASEPSLEAPYLRWCRGRQEHLRLARASRAGVPKNWVQLDYARGRFPGGPVAAEHQTRLRLRGFEDNGSQTSTTTGSTIGLRRRRS
jgi:hypothetical protein